ncbi:hypothetical protein ACFUTX_14820 [Microbacterium sp. NPDC057407]|uniref:hypothetical protein n=1 Tax=Microbacterium sp. NPDC057407 TaxID=3346120 RepID=UPI00366EEFA9
MPHDRRPTLLRTLTGGLALAAAALLVAGCQAAAPEPQQTADATPSVSPRPPGATPTPIETQTPGATLEVPESCDDIYSGEMRAALESENPPLNDPGVTMLSTQNVDLIQIIDGGAATLRCTWGVPSEFGLATNVTALDADQSETVARELGESGFDCQPLGDGTVCRMEQKGVTLDDKEYTSGETHYVGEGGWVSTAWINFSPEGYTEDIVATIWG